MNKQAEVFSQAAAEMKTERYWTHEDPAQELEFLQSLMDVLKEVAYQFDRREILDPAALEVYRKIAPSQMPAMFPTSTELVLVDALQQRIEAVYRQIEEG
ncbi:hypothetical protein [Glutamicibacter arilaitensis]|uniref:hypothetical protein n=1 Tax=Glutamicibacter arilaitensis TaxID=256701 RepID=UPI003F91BE32